MAVRGELYSKIKDQIDAGDMRAAYRTFEELPLKDQIAINITPGIGDAIAAYEIGEFGRRARTNIQEDDKLGAVGNIALLGLAGLSLYPLFRFLRGARGLKSVPKKTEKPPVEEPLKPSAPKETLETPQIPEVKPFEPKGIEETSYKTGLRLGDSSNVESLDEIVLGSKARKWINGIDQPKIKPLSKKIQKLPIEQWKMQLEQAGVPKGELRLLKILNESNELHPKLISEAAGAKSVSRQFIDDYMARSQRNAINIRNTPTRLLESSTQRPNNIDIDTQGQLNYFVRGSGEYRLIDIHNNTYTANSQDAINDLTGKNMYVFDGFAIGAPGARFRNLFGDLPQNQRDEIDKIFKELDIDETSRGTNIFRMQSDFQNEASRQRNVMLTPHRRATENLDRAINNPFSEGNILEKFLELRGSQAENLRKSMDPEFFEAMSGGREMFKKYLGPKLYAQVTKNYDKEIIRILDELGYPRDEFGSMFEFLRNSADYGKRNANLGEKDKVLEYLLRSDVFKENPKLNDELADLIMAKYKANDAFKEKVLLGNPTGFIKPALMKKLNKSLKVYNDKVSSLNKAQLKGKEFDDALDQLNQDILNLGIDSFVFSPKDLVRATGKSFEESLPLSPREIFFSTDARGRQKYIDVADDDMSLSKAYFDDLIDDNSNVFDAGDGVKILKKAAGISDMSRGFKIDPYFDAGNTKYFKLPVRTQVLKAAKNNEDFVYIGKQRAAEESLDTELIRTYQDAQKELGKILDELNVDKKNVLKTIEGTDTEFDGTYLKLTDEIKEKIRKLGINAFKKGGAVGLAEGAPTSQELLEERLEEIQKLLEFRVYDNLFRGGTLDELYKDYDLAKDVKKQFVDETESRLRESLEIPFKDEVIDILQSDDPRADIEQRLDVFGTKQIDRALQGLNLPIDIRKTQRGTEFEKDIYTGDKLDIDFAGFKPDDGDFTGDIDLRYKDAGRFGNIDIQSSLDELGDINTSGKYRYTKGPFDVRAVKYPGQNIALSGRYILDKDIFPADSFYGQTYQIPTRLEISKTPNRDLYGKYEVDILGGEGQSLVPIRDFNIAPRTRLGGRGSIGLSLMVDTLRNAGLRLQYMYENPKTGGFFNLTYDPRKPMVSKNIENQTTAFGLPQVFPNVPLEDLVGFTDPKDVDTYFFKEDPLPSLMDVNNILNIEFGRQF